MRSVAHARLSLLSACVLAALAAAPSPLAAAPVAGSVKGRIRLSGKLPGNPVIRMGMDPMCAQMTRGARVVQETVLAAADGSLANVFVELQGKFPQSPVPADPVVIDQRGCVYGPRVVGARAGQTLQVRNDDALLHNVHSLSAVGNVFNVGQPKAGMVYSFRLKDVERMLRLKCDIHSWMTAYVGVVDHPYFAVSGTAGTFEIANVPAGAYTVQVWHERYGRLTAAVRVGAGAAATVDFTYTGNEPPPTVGIEDLAVPAGALTARLIGPADSR
jgi:plastocyanin